MFVLSSETYQSRIKVQQVYHNIESNHTTMFVLTCSKSRNIQWHRQAGAHWGMCPQTPLHAPVHIPLMDCGLLKVHVCFHANPGLLAKVHVWSVFLELQISADMYHAAQTQLPWICYQKHKRVFWWEKQWSPKSLQPLWNLNCTWMTVALTGWMESEQKILNIIPFQF